jgi:hypothetical protein
LSSPIWGKIEFFFPFCATQGILPKKREEFMRRIDAREIERVSQRIGEASLDPAMWPTIMEDLYRRVSATGAALLQTDVRTPDIPRTPGVDQLYREYFANGWHERDLSADRGVPLLLSTEKVVIDQDFTSPEEMRRDAYYYGARLRLGFQWFAAIGFWPGNRCGHFLSNGRSKRGHSIRRTKFS